MKSSKAGPGSAALMMEHWMPPDFKLQDEVSATQELRTLPVAHRTIDWRQLSKFSDEQSLRAGQTRLTANKKKQSSMSMSIKESARALDHWTNKAQELMLPEAQPTVAIGRKKPLVKKKPPKMRRDSLQTLNVSSQQPRQSYDSGQVVIEADTKCEKRYLKKKAAASKA